MHASRMYDEHGNPLDSPREFRRYKEGLRRGFFLGLAAGFVVLVLVVLNLLASGAHL